MAKKNKKRSAPVRKQSWGKMHVRSLLYKHYKSRYKSWQDTKGDADEAIKALREKGVRRLSKKAVIEVVKRKRLQEIQKAKETHQPKESVYDLLKNHPALLNPFHFFEAKDICNQWENVSGKLMMGSRYIWTTGQLYKGSELMPYSETFQNYANNLEKLQSEPRKGGDEYEQDWYFRLELEKAIWLEESKAYVIMAITCDAEGHRQYYFDEPFEEEEPEIVSPEGIIEGEPEAAPPEKPTPPQPEKPAPAPGELTPEMRVEIEKERVRVEAQEKSKTEVKIKAIESAERLLEKGVISFDQYMKLIEKLY